MNTYPLIYDSENISDIRVQRVAKKSSLDDLLQSCPYHRKSTLKRRIFENFQVAILNMYRCKQACIKQLGSLLSRRKQFS